MKPEWLAELSEGLIVLSAASQGEMGQLLLAEKNEQAQQYAGWRPCYGDRFYLEVQRTCALVMKIACMPRCAGGAAGTAGGGHQRCAVYSP